MNSFAQKGDTTNVIINNLQQHKCCDTVSIDITAVIPDNVEVTILMITTPTAQQKVISKLDTSISQLKQTKELLKIIAVEHGIDTTAVFVKPDDKSIGIDGK